MSAALAFRKISFEEFVFWESRSQVKHEFYDGMIVAMAGATFAHNRISSNLNYLLGAHERAGGCPSYGSDALVRTPEDEGFFPDATLVCDAEIVDAPIMTIFNPTVVFEILSPSTEHLDRTKKLAAYRAFPSIRAVVLIGSQVRSVEVFFPEETGGWRKVAYLQPNDVAEVPSGGLRLPLEELYRNARLTKD